MIGDQLSLILLPTNKCNVACEYCFEDKTADFITLDQLSTVIDKLVLYPQITQIVHDITDTR